MTSNVINNKSILEFNLQKYLFRYRVTNIVTYNKSLYGFVIQSAQKKQQKKSIFCHLYKMHELIEPSKL